MSTDARVELLSGTRPVHPVELPKPKKAKPAITPTLEEKPEWAAPEPPSVRPRKAAPAAPATGPPPVLAGYLTREQLAEQFDVGFRTLERWAVLRVGPKVTHVGRVPYYAISDVQAWLAAGGMKAQQRNRPRVQRPARAGRRSAA
jgi:hypothetical protein